MLLIHNFRIWLDSGFIRKAWITNTQISHNDASIAWLASNPEVYRGMTMWQITDQCTLAPSEGLIMQTSSSSNGKEGEHS